MTIHPAGTVPASVWGDWPEIEGTATAFFDLVVEMEVSVVNVALEMLADDTVGHVWIDILNPRPREDGVLDPVTLYTSSEPIITASDDTPAGQPFDGGLVQALSFRRSILNGGDFGGAIVAQGEIVLDNRESDFDDLIRQWTFEETAVSVSVGRQGDRVEDFTLVQAGTGGVEEATLAELRVPVRDGMRLLDAPLVEAVYAGTGGVEGGQDLEGKRKPFAAGFSSNITPPLLDGNLKLFQVHDGAIQAIPAVYANAVPLALQEDFATADELIAADISEGKFATCLAQGLFRVAYVLQGNLITCDVEGHADADFAGTVGAILRRLAELAGVTDFDEAAFESFEAVHGYEAGWWWGVDDSSSFLDAANIVAGFGIYFGFLRGGMFTVGRVEAPTSFPALYIAETDILDDSGGIDRSPLPSGVNPPPWRWRVPWGINHTVMTGTQLAGVLEVNEERRQWLAEPRRFATAASAEIKAASTNPRDRDPVAGCLRNRADAEAFAAFLLDLWREPRSLWRVPIFREGHALDIGRIVHVTYTDRFDLAAGLPGFLVDIDEDAATGRVSLMMVA